MAAVILGAALMASACSEDPPVLESSAVGPASTTTSSVASTTVTTTGTTTSITGEDGLPPFPTNFGATVNVNTIDDFEKSFDFLVEASGRDDGDGDQFVPLPTRATGRHNDQDLSYYRINEGLVIGVTTGTAGVITSHAMIFDPDAESFSPVMATYLTVVLPDAQYIEPMIAFIDDPTADDQIDTFGPHEVQIVRSGEDPTEDPIFVMTIASADNPVVGHRDAAIALAEAAAQAIRDNPGVAVDDIEPVTRERAAERDLTIDECAVAADGVRVTGRVSNNGSITRTYLLRAEIYDPAGAREVPGVFGNGVEPGETWEFDESWDLTPGEWNRCEIGLVDPGILGEDEFPS